MLHLERKRTERSGNPFLLMLLHIDGLAGAKGADEIIKRISRALSSSTRETDKKGWAYRESAIGIIFTEINIADSKAIERKINAGLQAELGMKLAAKIRISCHVFPEEYDARHPSRSLDLRLYPDRSKRKPLKRISRSIKRAVDIAGSIAALIVFSPVFLIVPVLIKLSSKGPVFFRQERVGRFGKVFTFLKFRSMYANNDPSIHKEYIKKLIREQKGREGEDESCGKSRVYKIKDDPRVTPVGRFLRKTSLDEFPQFINVLRGDMSLVGPRPPIPYEFENYDIWHRRRVLEVRPGITGLWQVTGRSTTTFDEMVRMDLEYIQKWSLWLDMKLLARTPWVVLTGKGAY